MSGLKGIEDLTGKTRVRIMLCLQQMHVKGSVNYTKDYTIIMTNIITAFGHFCPKTMIETSFMSQCP